ncbi:MAG: thioredoxin family protein [Candidatus Aminicenantes bacterium]|jgi:glutaredoxin|nr:thioredoxin family protein [Candidatus Aminicenantes bacterium]
MDYLLFTLPNCGDCAVLKKHIAGIDLNVQEFSLVQKESKIKIREFLKVLKRDEKGAIVIPTLIVLEKKEVAAVLHTPEDLDQWLKSRA